MKFCNRAAKLQRLRGCWVRSRVVILLKNPLANFDLWVTTVLPVMIFIDVYRNCETT